ncbi:MAG: 50S ribosomal protein L29 [Meiothermus sp.]|nr:50S ribosomal protein L29 [Meiothermus sp.]
MPTTKPNELRKLSVAELQKRVTDSKRELMELRFQASIGQLEKNHVVAQTRQEIARMLTIIGEKERGETVVAKETALVAKPAKKAPARKAKS